LEISDSEYRMFGRPPFGPEEKTFEGFIKAIRAGELAFEDEKVTVSEGAKSFVKSLLCVDPAKRVSAEEALLDPWLIEKIRGKE
jgi:serine/threonine protein kinase